MSNQSRQIVDVFSPPLQSFCQISCTGFSNLCAGLLEVISESRMRFSKRWPCAKKNLLVFESLENRNLLAGDSSLLLQLMSGTEAVASSLRQSVAQKRVSMEETSISGLFELRGKKSVLERLGAKWSTPSGVEFVQHVDFTKPVKVALNPNDPGFTNGSLWGLDGTYGASAPPAWDISTNSTAVTIADIDTGIDYTHPDLYSNIWINQGEIPAPIRNVLIDTDADSRLTFWDLSDSRNQGTGKITDLNANGRIDGGDLLQPAANGGWSDGVSNNGDSFVDDLIGWDFFSNDNNPYDDHGHGTHTTGTIAGVGNNATGVVGLNWKAQVMALKFMGTSGEGSDLGAAQAVEYAARQGARVSNNSWGSSEFRAVLFDAIRFAQDQGQIFVAAAGNSGTDNDIYPHYPSNYHTYNNVTLDNVVSVAAINSSGLKASFSNFGATSVDLAAPGHNILSTVPGGYAYMNGTSMATPHVAGAVALVLAKNPTWTVTQVINQVLSTVSPLSSLAGKVVTGGTLNAFAALGGSSGGTAGMTIDDGSTGYAETGGGWSTGSVAGGFQGDYRFHYSGAGSSTASWTATGLSPGSYKVQATWTAGANRASNAPFTIFDGSTALGTVAINQRFAPNDELANNQRWEDLGTFAVSSGTLKVRLSDAASGVVIADAVRIVPVSSSPPANPDLSWVAFDAPASVTAGSSFTISRTYAIANSAVSANFTIGYYRSGDSVFGNSDDVLFGSESLSNSTDKSVGNHAGTSPSFIIPVAGSYHLFARLDDGGSVTENNETNNVSAADAITVTTSTSSGSIIDDGEPGYAESGTWATGSVAGGFQGDYRYRAAGSGTSSASWTFSGLSSGTYRVYATWVTGSNRSSSAPFTAFDGSTLLATVAIDQRVAPNDELASNQWWEALGTFSITAGTLKIQLKETSNGYVIADAIRIAPVSSVSRCATVGRQRAKRCNLAGRREGRHIIRSFDNGRERFD